MDTKKSSLFAFFRYLGWLAREYRFGLVIQFLESIASGAQSIVTALLVGKTLQYITDRVYTGTLHDSFVIEMGVLIVVYGLFELIFFIRQRLNPILLTKLEASFFERFFDGVNRLSVLQLEKNDVRELIERSRQKSMQAINSLVGRLTDFVAAIIRTGIAAGVLIAYMPALFLFFIPIFAFMLWLRIFIYEKFRKLEDVEIRARYRAAYPYSRPLGNVDSVFENRIYGLSYFLKRSFLKAYQDNLRTYKMSELKYGSWLGFPDVTLSIVWFGSVIWKTIQLSKVGALIVESATIVLSQSMQFFDSILQSINRYTSIVFHIKQYMYLEELEALGDENQESEKNRKHIPVPQKQLHGIEFKNAGFQYEADKEEDKKWIFEDLNLVFEPGVNYAIVGPNGAGKTTLIKMITGMYVPQKGDVLIDGVSTKDIDLESWHKELGLVMQDYNKYSISVKENIVFGDLDKIDDEALMKTSAERAEADKVIEQLPAGYETPIGRWLKDSVDLSGGQWQSLAIARGYFKNASVIILDEPTSAIDALREERIFNTLYDAYKEKTVIAISHRFSTVRRADIIYVLDEGKVVESGSHDELMKRKGLYHKMFTTQAKAYA